MSQTTYQVILSTDGKHTVIVSCDEPESANLALNWAKATYAQVVERYGMKGEQRPTEAEPNGEAEEVPICAVHNLPMAKVNGKKGEFWSCHQKDGDEWCKYRPPRTAGEA